MQQWQTTLRSQVSCGANDARDKAVELAKLTAGFPLQGMDDISSDLRIEMFFEALDGLPAWAVREARLSIVAGRTSFGRPFGPGPIEFADLVRSALLTINDDLRDIGTLLSAPSLDEEATPDERARVKSGFDKLKFEMKPNVQP